MHRVPALGLSVALPDGPLRCLGRVGGTDGVAPTDHRVVSLERQGDRRSRTHELDQLLEERPTTVNLVERLRLRTGELHLTHGPDPEARRLGCRQDVAGVASRHGVGLDHRESETSCHWSSCRRSVVGWSRGDVTWMIDGRKPLYPLIISHPPKVLLELALENLHHVHRAAHDAHSGGLEGL